jgi:hypothetical protein
LLGSSTMGGALADLHLPGVRIIVSAIVSEVLR